MYFYIFLINKQIGKRQDVHEEKAAKDRRLKKKTWKTAITKKAVKSSHSASGLLNTAGRAVSQEEMEVFPPPVATGPSYCPEKTLHF